VANKAVTPDKVQFERPRARRYPFVASIELVDVQSEVRVQGRVTDLSLYRCGANASKSSRAGTKMRIRITSKGSTFSALGKVAYATADGDMGIVFARIEPNDQRILEKWIGELRGH
jgi:hypothetical protein